MHHNVGTCDMFRCKQQCINESKTYQKNHLFGKKFHHKYTNSPHHPQKNKGEIKF